MNRAKNIICRVTATKWLTPSVVSIRFQPNKTFKFESGQFLSVVIPAEFSPTRSPLRRVYSFANGYSDAIQNGYELCIKVVRPRSGMGAGSNYMASLKYGDRFQATAPYGDFVFQPSSEEVEPSIVFIASGTGIAPFRSMIQDPIFLDRMPSRVHCILGVRNEKEILFREDFERLGIQVVPCLSEPGLDRSHSDPSLFGGRITDFLKSLPMDWGWHSTQFYLCGNGLMIEDVRNILMHGHAISEQLIFQETYFKSVDRRVHSAAVDIPITKKRAA